MYTIVRDLAFTPEESGEPQQVFEQKSDMTRDALHTRLTLNVFYPTPLFPVPPTPTPASPAR